MRLCTFSFLFLIYACSTPAESETDKNNTEPLYTENTDLVNEDELASTEVAETEITEINSETSPSSEYEDIDWEEYEASMTNDYSFVILISTKNYDAALERAKDASEKLGYPLDLRGLHPNEETGLSFSKEVCEGICGGGMVEYPQYLPRNDWGESKYVSVEYSNGFDGYTPGYYIVIVASGEKGDPVVQEALDESREFYEDAYAKTCGVWMGCGC